MNRSTRDVDVTEYQGGEATERDDVVAVEEPLEIRLGYERRGRRVQKPVSVTMRTPGDDFELAAGFLFSESILRDPSDLDDIVHCGEGANTNVVRVELATGVEIDFRRLQRHFYTTSSCGVCGKTSLEALDVSGCDPLDPDDVRISAARIHELPARLLEKQDVFDRTGGLHATALFDTDATLLSSREDIGRHNAMDKLIGRRFLDSSLPLAGTVAMLSGRASFELLQKALMAKIPIVVAVGAPSSLAVDLAQRFGITLCGFARDRRFNVYAHHERLM